MVILNLVILLFGVCIHEPFANAAPCKVKDQDCIEDVFYDIMKLTFDGIPEIGIEPIDPSYFDTIDASLGSIKLVFKNVTVSGMSKCVTSRVRLNSDSLELDLLCPSLTLTSKYLANGQILILPIHGEGEANLKSGQISATIITKHKKVKKSDGKNHWQFVITKIKANAIDPMQFDLTNLFNGQKQLSDAFLIFAHENWKTISEILLEPVMRPGLQDIMRRINKYLETMKTYDDIISD